MLLAAAVAFLLGLLTLWIAYDTYRDYQERLLEQMDAQSTRIDEILSQDIEQAGYLLEILGRQILKKDNRSHAEMAQILRSYQTDKTVFNLFAWVDDSHRIVATNTAGVLPLAQDVSDRDYIKKGISTPWKVQIGRPIQGRASDDWVVPIAMGMDDENGQYLGAVLTSLNVEKLNAQIRDALGDKNTDFGLITSTFLEVSSSAKTPDFINNYFPLSALKLVDFEKKPKAPFAAAQSKNASKMLTYYRHSERYSFVMLMGLDMATQIKPFLAQLGQRLLPLLLIAIFAALVLLTIRRRVIQPLGDLGKEAERLIRGESIARIVTGPTEITYLGKLLQQISAYIQERRRIEFEQKAKLTFLKRAKDTAEISNRVKVDFLTSMSHEFRTPLNTISGFIELMKNEVYGAIGNDRYRQYVADIHDSVTSLQSLVNDVIALSKAEDAQSDTQEKPLELQLVVARSIRNLADKLKDAGVTVENRVAEDLPKLRVDETRLRQVIHNLLFNALSHTPTGGSIVVEARVAEDKLHQPVFEIIITDFGAKRLPSGRDDEGEHAPRKGKRALGARPGNLGVPLTKALVAMQQATLEVDSPPGKATTVTVRYPKEKIVL